MTAQAWSITEDILPWTAFTVAMVLLLMVPTRGRSPLQSDAKGFFVASIGCYMIATTASILKGLGMQPWWMPPVVASVEALWVPFLLFGVYSMYSRQKLDDARAASEAVLRTGEMADEIAETSPAAIVVLSDSGHVTFANSVARELFSLPDDPDCAPRCPDLVLRFERAERAARAQAAGLQTLLVPDPLREEPVVVESPGGWHKHLSVNTSPFVAEDGSVGGVVAAFLERGGAPGAA